MSVSVRRKCGALHETAERVEKIWRNCPDREGNIALLNAATLMRDAAKTLERLDAENAANVVRVASLTIARDELYENNAMLRELARDAIRTISCDRCWRKDGCVPTRCAWDERADELGIEVYA